jgi:predicted nucleotidyltransferase component of viral defense system
MVDYWLKEEQKLIKFKMKIKIIRKNNDNWWYNNHVGEEFEFIDIANTREPSIHVENMTSMYSVPHQVFIEHTNYFQIIRKEKLRKINVTY